MAGNLSTCRTCHPILELILLSACRRASPPDPHQGQAAPGPLAFGEESSSSSSEIPPSGLPTPAPTLPLIPDASTSPGQGTASLRAPHARFAARGSARPLPESVSSVLGGASDGDGDGIPSLDGDDLWAGAAGARGLPVSGGVITPGPPLPPTQLPAPCHPYALARPSTPKRAWRERRSRAARTHAQ